ncbi:MAG: S49 family peptidase [Methanocellales archaeon]
MGIEIKNLGSNILVIIAGIFLGVLIFNLFFEQPSVGVIKIEGSVLENQRTQDIISMLRYAREVNSIKAVVLVIDSPGGEASRCEEVYIEVLQLRREKPVIASIGATGASGAYYIAVAANYIYAKPTSSVGSIGVTAILPQPITLPEDRIITGPYKTTGKDRKQFAATVEAVKEGFLRAVIQQRGDRLKLTKEELSRAELYIGIDAKRNGLVDDIGSISQAIAKAADLAGIANYRTIDINKELNITSTNFPLLVNESYLNQQSNTAPVTYFLYLEPR